MVVDFALIDRGHDATDIGRSDRIFHALADATRRDIALTAMGQEHSVSALARRYPMSITAVQKHVTVLERAGLVTKHKHGREQLVRGNIDAVRTAVALLDRLEAVWRARLDAFGDVLDELDTDRTARPLASTTSPEPAISVPTSPPTSPPTTPPTTHKGAPT